MNEQYFGTGAHESPKDYRTIPHSTMGGILPTAGGIHYDPTKDIENQHRVGICTGISVVQNVEKATGKKYSPDFQYLLEKRNDGNWDEGSSILSSLKVGTNIGFLPAELWTATTEADRALPYDQYIAKLQAIPETEVQRLISLCERPLLGYTSVDVSNPTNIAQSILDSSTGIVARYSTGREWYCKPDGTISWLSTDIDPITPFEAPTGGHAINVSAYDFTNGFIFEHPNTWGGSTTPEWPTVWDKDGICTIDWNKYKMTEAWVPHYTPIPVIVNRPNLPVHQPLSQNLYFGCKNDDVKRLQHVLGVLPESGYFGILTMRAVIAYQKANGISPAVGFVGPLTRASLNAKYFN